MAAAADSAFWCTSHILARLLSTKLSHSQWGLPLLDGWESPGLGRARSLGASSLLCRQSRIVANTSSATASSLVEIQATCGVCTPPGRSLSVLPYWSLGLAAQWQVCPPLGSAEAYADGGLSR